MSKNIHCSDMKSNRSSWRAGVLALGLLSITTLSFSQAAKPAEKTKTAEKPAEAKPTPRMDGHPDLNGFWNQVAPTQFAQRAKDGSILYEFSVNFDETISVCTDDSCQLPNQPPYKPEVMGKVKEIAATEYLGTSPLDPEMLCKPHGVPRTGMG